MKEYFLRPYIRFAACVVFGRAEPPIAYLQKESERNRKTDCETHNCREELGCLYKLWGTDLKSRREDAREC